MATLGIHWEIFRRSQSQLPGLGLQPTSRMPLGRSTDAAGPRETGTDCCFSSPGLLRTMAAATASLHRTHPQDLCLNRYPGPCCTGQALPAPMPKPCNGTPTPGMPQFQHATRAQQCDQEPSCQQRQGNASRTKSPPQGSPMRGPLGVVLVSVLVLVLELVLVAARI